MQCPCGAVTKAITFAEHIVVDECEGCGRRLNMNTFLTMGGRICCIQCKAQSKRTKQQCRAPAMKGKAVCRTHGGLSTGPKTKEGRIRCADAKTIHGRGTRQTRSDTSSKLGELYELEVMARAAGLIVGSMVRGRTAGS